MIWASLFMAPPIEWIPFYETYLGMSILLLIELSDFYIFKLILIKIL